ncbi:MAG: protein kinase [Planctomycetes bacterium]|nr:protein kinase [Planctomycetota bacterium]
MSLSPMETDRRLGNLLVELKLARPDEVERALAEVERGAENGDAVRLGRLLVRRGVLSPDQVRSALEAGGLPALVCPDCGSPLDATGVPPGLRPPCPICRAQGPGSRATLVEPRPASLDTPTFLPKAPSTIATLAFEPAQRLGEGEARLPLAGAPLCLADGPRTLPAAPTEPGERPAPERDGTPFGRYRLLSVLGVGGMGVVWKAWDSQLQRLVALKQVRRDVGSGNDGAERFLREARLAAGLRHPNVIAVHDVGTIDGKDYLTMDYIEGKTFSDFLESTREAKRSGSQRGTDRLRDEIRLLTEVAEAVGYAHLQGIVHRDLKPSNILLGRGGVPYVLDFGLAKQVGAAEDGRLPRPSDAVTVSGQVLGTPGYLSPEQANGDTGTVGTRSDVWALGVMLYEVLTGALPFEGITELEALYKTLHRDPDPPRRKYRHAPMELEAVCLKAIEKEPARRFATAREFAEELRRWLCGETVRTRSPSRAYRVWRWLARRKARVAAATAVASLVVGTLAWAWFERSSARALEDARRRARLAVDAAKLSRGDARLSQLAAAIEADSECFEAWLLRSRARWQRGFLLEALEDVDRAVRLRPEDAAARLLRFRMLKLAFPGFDDASEDLRVVALGRADDAAVSVARAWLARREQGLAPALEAFQRVVLAEPRRFDAWLGLGWCRLEAREWARAADAAQSARGLDPEDPEAGALAAAVLLARCSYEEAIAAANGVLERCPWLPEVALDRAEACRLAGDGAAALDAYRKGGDVLALAFDNFVLARGASAKAWDRGGLERRALSGRARALANTGRAAEARPLLERLRREGEPLGLLEARLARDERNAVAESACLEGALAAKEPGAQAEWAAFLLRAGRTAESDAAFERALVADAPPTLDRLYVSMAEPVLEELARGAPSSKAEPEAFLRAERPLLRALDLDPRNAQARVRLGAVRMLMLDPVRARAELDAAVEANPRSAEAWRARGCLVRDFREQRDLERSEADLRQALELEPGSGETRLELAAWALRAGRLEEALAGVDAVLGSGWRRARVWKVRADALSKLGRKEEAEQALAAWRAGPVEDAAGRRAFGLAQVWANHAKRDDCARDFCNRAIELDPRTALYYHFRGDTYLRSARLAEMFLDKARALRLDPVRNVDLLARCLEIRAQPAFAALARPQMLEVARREPGDPCALFVKGFGDLLFGDDEAAYAQFGRVLELDGGFASALVFRAMAAVRTRRFREAEEALRKAEGAGAGGGAPDPLGRLVGAALLAAEGRREEAAQVLGLVGRGGAVSWRVLQELRELDVLREDPRYRALRGEE